MSIFVFVAREAPTRYIKILEDIQSEHHIYLFHSTSCSTDVNIYPPHAQGGACFRFVDGPFHILDGDMKDRMYLDPLHPQGGK